jgi:predicted transcriptional regulator
MSIVTAILDLLNERKQLSLSEISILCKVREEVAEEILKQLERKGKVVKKNISCSGCMKSCDSCLKRGDLIYYRKRE